MTEDCLDLLKKALNYHDKSKNFVPLPSDSRIFLYFSMQIHKQTTTLDDTVRSMKFHTNTVA